ncbi:MAG TPA: DUF1565 domain-containing protein [Myxococcales bacterium]|nr:DUF1565 domain-containing protein [Myxococcales bacterium]
MRWILIGIFVVLGCSDSDSDASSADTGEDTVVAPDITEDDADTVVTSDIDELVDTKTDTDTQPDVPSECALQVNKTGTDSPQCGSVKEPCATITHTLKMAKSGCIQVGPGTYNQTSGETFPLRLAGLELRGAGHHPDDSPTIIDGSSGPNSKLFDIECPSGKTTLHKATLVMEGNAVATGIIAKAPLSGSKQFALLVLSGSSDIHDLRTEGGIDGIYVAGASVVSIRDSQITLAGHAGIKPGGTSQVTIDHCVIWQNKDAVEPVCKAKTIIQNTEAVCNGNGLEALGGAHTTLIGNHVHHNENGVAARGANAFISMRDNVVENNKYGVLMLASTLDMGSTDDPGNNTFVNNEFASLMLRNVSNTTMAVGNTWMPNVDGANESGQYTADVKLSVSAETCPNTSFAGSIDKAIPANCTGSGSVTPDTNYQNIVLFNGSCSDTPDGGMPSVILSE